jgi:5-methylcytosine-specific restriction endonuclease McrA
MNSGNSRVKTNNQMRRSEALARRSANNCAEARKNERTAQAARQAQKPVAPPKPLHDGRKDQRTLAYADYLRTQHWSIVRTKMVKRAGRKCQNCGTTGRLNVHHLTYAHLWFEYPADLQVLCETCHAITHGAFIYAA